MVSPHSIGIHKDLHRARPSTDDVRPGYVLHTGETLGHFVGNAAKRHVVYGGTRDLRLATGNGERGLRSRKRLLIFFVWYAIFGCFLFDLLTCSGICR